MSKNLLCFIASIIICTPSFSQPERLIVTEKTPSRITLTEKDRYFIDFSKAWFGTISLNIPDNEYEGKITIRLGEKSKKNAVDMNPGGSIRKFEGEIELEKGKDTYELQLPDFVPPSWGKNYYVPLPDHVPNVLPFRYCEIIDCPVKIETENIKMLAVHYPFNDSASYFHSSDSTLNAVWDLCKHSIVATTFCGVYVDGDRERRPYEADAYINQLAHYCLDAEYDLARYTTEYFFKHPTWPTEWQFHTIFMAWQDYMYTGNTELFEKHYPALLKRCLINFERPDGLISTFDSTLNRSMQQLLNFPPDVFIKDLVDWPPSERDNYELKAYNTTVNAFYYQSLLYMNKIALLLDKKEDAEYTEKATQKVYDAFQKSFFDPNTGLYVDGEGSAHSSLHANMYALVFGLVPGEHKTKIIEFIKSKGMACSVYGAQYLLEALYQENEAEYALELMTAKNDRSWWNMIEAGSTIALEAWDIKYKPNLDWNHAWGAAPANIIPRQLFGIQPIKPRFEEFQIKLQAGDLEFAEIKKPTIKGSIYCSFRQSSNSMNISFEIPNNTKCLVRLMDYEYKNMDLYINDKKSEFMKVSEGIQFHLSPGKYKVTLKQ